jgi:hypothetical protein
MGTFDFSIQLWRLGLDVDMLHSLIFDMPVKTSLKLMSSIGSDRADPEGESFHNIVHELDGALLVMFWEDLQCPDTRRIIDRGVLITFNQLSFLVFQL